MNDIMLFVQMMFWVLAGVLTVGILTLVVSIILLRVGAYVTNIVRKARANRGGPDSSSRW